MLQILVNNTDLDYPDNIKISLKLRNPLFYDIGSFSLNFSLPITNKNHKTFNWMNKHGNNSFNEEYYDCVIKYGIHSFHGRLKVKSNKNSFVCNLLTDSGSFNSSIAEKKMNELELGGTKTYNIWTDYTNELIASTTSGFPEFNFVAFPVYNYNMYLDTSYENFAVSERKTFDRYEINSTYVEFTDNKTSWPYLVYVIEQIYNEHGFTIEENFFYKNKDLMKLVCIGATPDKVDLTASPITFSLSDIMPHSTIKYNLKQFRNLLNFTVFIRDNKAYILKNEDIILDDEIIDISKKCENNPIIEEEIKGGFELVFNSDDDYFKENTFNFYDFEYKVKPSVVNISDLPSGDEPGTIRLVTAVDMFYKVEYDSYGSPWWTEFCENIYTRYKFGDGKNKIETTAVPFLEQMLYRLGHYSYSNDLKILLPVMKIKGNIFIRDNFEDFNLHLLFYRGMQEGELSQEYPFASYKRTNYNGDTIADTSLTLKWEGDDGIYENFWKNWLNWMTKRKSITDFVNWSFADIANLKMFKKHHIVNNNVLIDSIDITLTKDEIIPGTTKMWII